MVDIRVNQIRSGVAWSSSGERSNKFYLSKASARKAGARLEGVYNSLHVITSKPQDTSAEVYKFYSNLYSSNPPSTDSIQSFISSSGPSYSQVDIFYPITPEEVTEAIKTSPQIKSPGQDGIPFEVHRKFSYQLSPILTKTVQPVHV